MCSELGEVWTLIKFEKNYAYFALLQCSLPLYRSELHT